MPATQELELLEWASGLQHVSGAARGTRHALAWLLGQRERRCGVCIRGLRRPAVEYNFECRVLTGEQHGAVCVPASCEAPAPPHQCNDATPSPRLPYPTPQEPEALPFCALSYSLVGILSTFLAATPMVRNALLGIVG